MIDKRLNVLILEDSKTDEALLKRYLLKAAPNSMITVARNREDFFEKIEWSVPDLILSDYRLPSMNGLDALLYVRDKLSVVPFIFVTGILNNEEEAAGAILQGASGFVLKENLKQLPEKIVEVMEKAEAEKSSAAAEERRWREAGISMQKAMSMLAKSPAFENKEEINKLLGEVMQAIQD